MISFPFFCPSCLQQTNASADPVSLLLAGRAGLAITCENCEATFTGEYDEATQTLVLKGGPIASE